MKRILTVACVLVGLGVSAAQAETPGTSGPIEFKFVTKVGDVERIKLTVKVVGSMQMPGPMQAQKFSQTIEQVLAGKCTKVNPDKSAVFEVSIERYAFKMSMMGMAMEFDSATFDPEKAPNPMAKVMGKLGTAMTKVTFTVVVGPDGRPLKLEGLSKAVGKIIEDLGDEGELGQMKGMLEQMEGVFDDEFMYQEMEGHYRIVPPGGQARIGDTWEDKWEFRMPMFNAKCQGKGRYELVGVETIGGRSCAKIRIKESYEMVKRDESDEANGGGDTQATKTIFDRMNFEMSSSGAEGVGYWDYEEGTLVRLRQADNLTIRIEMKADPDAENPKMKHGFGTIVQKLKTSTSLDLIEGDPQTEPEKSASAEGAPSSPER